MTVIQGCRNWW